MPPDRRTRERGCPLQRRWATCSAPPSIARVYMSPMGLATRRPSRRHMPREHEQESRSAKVLRWCAARLLLRTLTDEFAFRRISRIDVRVLPIQIEHHWQDIAASTPLPSDLSADQNGRRFRYTQERVTERVS